MLEELHSLREHGVFELCELPAGCRPLPAKWVLKIKRGAQGEIERFKTRYVAKGFEQVHGVDFFETWAPVGRYATLRALLSICVVWDLETKHIEIKCAFLNGVLHQDVYIVQPPMFHDGSRRVWKLKKALYGLKPATCEWHKALVQLLSELGFDRCHSDPALFVSKVGRCFIFLWVDDLLMFNEQSLLQPLVEKILTAFDGRDLKELNHVLGMEVKWDRETSTLSISHKQMISSLLERNNMSGCRCSPTLLVPREKIMSLSEDPSHEKASVSDHNRFMKAVRSIQYIAAVPRPDIAYVGHTFARHMASSATKHWLVVQHVLRYLQSTIDVALTFNGSGDSVVDVFSDADFANGASLKSVSGMVLRMYKNCVFWRSKRQDITAGDTTEAELIAMSSAANELMWIKQLCTDLSITAKKPTLWGDNKSANFLAVNPISCDTSKHIRARHLRVREYVAHDEMDVKWVGTREILADGFTKTLPGLALSDLRDKLHLRKS